MYPYTERYIKERIVITESGCWEWQRSKDRDGYGQVSRRSSGESLAHRLSFSIFKSCPDGLVVRHTCDNPPCVNPEHLELGTQLDNLYDGWRKGRIDNKGARKTTDQQHQEILEHLRNGTKQRDIAKLYNLSESRISTIKHRELRK